MQKLSETDNNSPMSKRPKFAAIGKETDHIDVRLSYKIVELFSEGLYASPNKAIEELVANAFDAGALNVQLLLPANLSEQNATIVVIDDGEGMNAQGLKHHWLIGSSNKRDLAVLPRGRQQIGKFGIGKLATYVLAGRLTHITKSKNKYFSTSMDYTLINTKEKSEVAPKGPIRIALRVLTEAQAKEALSTWRETPAYKEAGMRLFGNRSSPTWTVAIMSSLKPKVQELKQGTLEWVLRTALPLRPDFSIFLNGEKLVASKQGKGLLKKWILGKDIIKLPRPSPKGVKPFENKSADRSSEHRFGLDVPGIGRITGFAEAYKDLLTGKSDEIGRSTGFFVYALGRLINVLDGHFGISPDVLRHGTFGRFRLVAHIDSLDEELRSNREAISEGPLREIAQNVLIAIFNYVRSTIEKHERDEEPGARLGRKLAESPAGLSRRPIVELARAVLQDKAKSRSLIIPDLKTQQERSAFLDTLDERVSKGETFVTGLLIDYDGSPTDGIARYDTRTGNLRINALHPFVAAFYDDFTGKSAEPLELFAMAEVLAESHFHSIGVKAEQADEFLTARDQLLRYFANESGRQSAFAVALSLKEARNNPDKLEDKLCAAFTTLGFEVAQLGGAGKPDGVATALLSADERGQPRRYAVSFDAKSKTKDKGKIAAGTVKISTIVRHRDKYKCQHALVVGRAFPEGALATEIDDDRTKSAATGEAKTVTLITIDDLAKLVQLRPLKQVGLQELRGLFQCRLPKDSATWVTALEKKTVSKPPYAKIVVTIEQLQRKRAMAQVKYAALANELSHLSPPVNYATDDELRDVCKAMAQMAPGAMYATFDAVELDSSAANVVAAIDAATKKWKDEQ
jgi:Histidine kinase-, DNA gyrase B-, and HSP90-like ATPase